jgi:diaminopimelate decarboxylase
MGSESRDALLCRIAAQRGTPFYAYFMEDVYARTRTLRDAFAGRFALSYAVKANPAPGLLACLRGHVELLDVSSAGELEAALAAGFSGEQLSFTGPGKSERELTLAVERFGFVPGAQGGESQRGEVVLESVDEAEQLARIARALGRAVRVLVRIAPSRVPPGFGDSMAGKPVAFGIDEEELAPALRAIVALDDTLVLAGFHAYSGTQCLRVSSLAENYAIFAELFLRAASLTRKAPEKLIFGSGLGIAYHDGQEPLDLGALAEATSVTLAALAQYLPAARLVLETGRYLVGEAGVLVTRVLRTKDSRGTRIGICDAGMNHHLAAAGMFGMAIRRNYRMRNLNPRTESSGSYQLSGPLCTSLDVLARGVALAGLEAGDLIAIETSGAYGPSASPGRFISHAPIHEWLVEAREPNLAGDDVRSAAAHRSD